MGGAVCGRSYLNPDVVNIIHFIYIILAFGLVIFIHEFGHFLVARRVGIFIEKFSLGFGPALLKVKKDSTEFILSLIPFGGYVKMKGESPFEDTGDDDAFFSKSPFKRSLVVLAGPVNNFLLGFVIFCFTIWAGGVVIVQNKSAVGDVFVDSPAMRAGLKTGDKILSIDGNKLNSWDELAKAVHPNAEKELAFLIERNGNVFEKKITPQLNPQEKIGLIGITAPYERTRVPVYMAIIEAADRSAAITILTLKFMIYAIGGKVKAEIAGPVGIASMMNRKLKQGWLAFAEMVALISLNLGLINLFPIPLLDGWHITIFAWEAASKKFPSKKVYNAFQTAGVIIILSIIVFATRSDLIRIFAK